MAANSRMIAACAYVENDVGAVLLVRTRDRPDTWEMPGGRVEAGESLLDAVRREVAEESGIAIEPTAFVGLYEHVDLGILVALFRARPLGGRVRPQPGEILEAAYVDVADGALERLVTRPLARLRLADARAPTVSAAILDARTAAGEGRRLAPDTARTPSSPPSAPVPAATDSVGRELRGLQAAVARAVETLARGGDAGPALVDAMAHTARVAGMLGVDLGPAARPAQGGHGSSGTVRGSSQG
jgi:8-oxo-dGTP diphosphatase